jgi:RNA polymerase sigma-70 factor (ECF subfamily)
VHASLAHGEVAQERAHEVARETVSEQSAVPLTIEALFAAHAPFVWRVLRHFGVAAVDLEDQTQEVFLVAHRRLSDWNGEHPRAWLAAIARRCAAGYRRRGHRQHEELVHTVPDSTDSRDPSARAEIDFLNRVLASLDEDKRTVFFLYEVEEMSIRDVAEVVHCTVKAAYKRLYAARRELTRALGEIE